MLTFPPLSFWAESGAVALPLSRLSWTSPPRQSTDRAFSPADRSAWNMRGGGLGVLAGDRAVARGAEACGAGACSAEARGTEARGPRRVERGRISAVLKRAAVAVLSDGASARYWSARPSLGGLSEDASAGGGTAGPPLGGALLPGACGDWGAAGPYRGGLACWDPHPVGIDTRWRRSPGTSRAGTWIWPIPDFFLLHGNFSFRLFIS